MRFQYTIDAPIDLLHYLLRQGYSKDLTRALFLGEGEMKINGSLYAGDYMLKAGDVLEVELPHEECQINSYDAPIDILYENEWFLVVNKPSGLCVMRTHAHSEDHLTGRVKAYFERTHQDTGIHLVNRLDLETQGIVLFAKHQYIHWLFMQTKLEKKYTAHIKGILQPPVGMVDLPIERIPGDPKRRQVDPQGKPSQTEYRVLETESDSSFVEFILHTGRTHQIRVHMSALGHPLLGDWLYGCPEGTYDLTAYELSFTFPLDNHFYDIKLYEGD